MRRMSPCAVCSRHAHESSPSVAPAQFHLRMLPALLLYTACSYSATISQRDGSFREGYILGSDEEYLHVEARDGSEHDVRRADITDIDYPGNVLGTIGVVVAAVLLPIAAIGVANGASGTLGKCGVGGVFLAVTNWSNYYESREAASDFAPRRIQQTGKAKAFPQEPSTSSSSSGISQPGSPGPVAPKNGGVGGEPPVEPWRCLPGSAGTAFSLCW